MADRSRPSTARSGMKGSGGVGSSARGGTGGGPTPGGSLASARSRSGSAGPSARGGGDGAVSSGKTGGGPGFPSSLKTGGVKGIQIKSAVGKLPAGGTIKSAMGNARKTTVQVPGPTRARAVPLHATKKPVVVNRKLLDAYDRYATDLLMNQLVQEMEQIQIRKNLDSSVKSVLNTVSGQKRPISAHNTRILHILWADLKKTQIINKAFENLVDFAGEETLVEIQTCLTRKFESIAVKGANLDNTVFSNLEIKKVVDLVQENLKEGHDTGKVKGFIRAFTKALRKINIMSEKAEKTSEALELDTKLGLESASLTISGSAMEAFLNPAEVTVSVNGQDTDAGDFGMERKN